MSKTAIKIKSKLQINEVKDLNVVSILGLVFLTHLLHVSETSDDQIAVADRMGMRTRTFFFNPHILERVEVYFGVCATICHYIPHTSKVSSFQKLSNTSYTCNDHYLLPCHDVLVL